MLHAAERINGKVLWANLHLLFWLSLVPFVTGWMGENHFAPLPTAVYGVVLLAASSPTTSWRACWSRRRVRTRARGALGSDTKGKLSGLYAAAIPLAFVNQWIADALYVGWR